MIEIVYGLLPFMFLFLGSIMALSGNPNDGGKQSSSINYSLPFTNQILALVINTILIINKHDFIQKNGLYITANSLWIIEIIIIASLLISFSMKHSLIDSHSQPMAFSIFMLFISSIVGIFLTENLLVIAIFYLLSIISLGIFILFGDFKKKKQSMAKFTQVSVISSIILIITLLITEITFGTFSLTELGLKFNDASFTTRLIIFLGLFFGFGTLPGIFSFNLFL